MDAEWINAILGGMLIGISASLMLLLNGRVAGVSGIVYGTLNPAKESFAWRVCFIFGLVAGGFTLQLLKSDVFSGSLPTADWTVLIAGILVGFGTVLGSGCTSGHGVCGISRLSVRSLVATLLFMSSGILTVIILRNAGVLP